MKKGSSTERHRNHELPLSKSTNELLDLSRRGLKSLPLDKKFERFKRLSLDHNQLGSLGNLEQFQRLEELTLVSNRIADWRELQRIRHPQLLRKLRVKNNPLELEPNYRYQLLQHFPSLKVLDDWKLAAGASAEFHQIQQAIEVGLVEWVAIMIGLDKALTPQEGHRHSRIPTERLHDLKILLTQLTEHKSKAQQGSLLDKSKQIEKILQSTLEQIGSRSLSEEQALTTEYSYFSQLILQITEHSEHLVDYLLEQVRLCDESQEDQLKQSTQDSLYVIFVEFKALCASDFQKHHRMSSLETDVHTNRGFHRFPYLSTEGYFVDATLKIMLEIMQDLLGNIDGALNSKEPPVVAALPELQAINVQAHCSSVREQTHRTEVAELAEEDETLDGRNDPMYLEDYQESTPNQQQIAEVPTPLMVVLLNLLERYQLKHAFSRIRRTSLRSYTKLRNFAVFFSIRETIYKRLVFETIRKHSDEESQLEIEYGQLRLQQKIFRAWTRLLKNKARRLKLLTRILDRKSRVENTVKHFAFVRWKILNSRTLRYIRSIKDTGAPEEQIIHRPQLTARQIESEYARLHRQRSKRSVLAPFTNRGHVRSLRR